MRSTILSENQYDPKFMASEITKKITAPLAPPTAPPTAISKPLSAASNTAVLRLFIAPLLLVRWCGQAGNSPHRS
jgi:hypothetical protein